MDTYTLDQKAILKEELSLIKVLLISTLVIITMTYTITINPNSEGYINDIPLYVPFIIISIFIILFIRSVRFRLNHYKDFILKIQDEDRILIQQKNIPDLQINMKNVKRILHQKNGYYQLFMYHGDTPPPDLTQPSYLIPVSLLKNSDSLANYFFHFKEIELEKDSEPLSWKFKILFFFVISLVSTLMLGFFISKNSIFTFVSGAFLLTIIKSNYKKEKEKGKEFLSYFSIIIVIIILAKFAFTLKWIFN